MTAGLKGLLLALLAALGFSGLLCQLFSGEPLRRYLVYDVPIGVPFVLFVLERQSLRRPLDALVVVLALLRGLGPYAPFSGHALFLSYALGTGRGGWLRLTAALVLAQVVYLKLVVWDDWTAVSGIMLGGLAAGLGRRSP